MQSSKKAVKSRQKNRHHEAPLFPHSHSPVALFYHYIFFSRKGGGQVWKNFSSPLPTLGAFRRSRGFCLGTKTWVGRFCERVVCWSGAQQKRLLSLIVMKAISGIWKTVSIVHFFCARCGGFLFTRFFFSSLSFFSLLQPIQLAGVNSAAMCTRFVPASPSSSPHWIEWVDTAWQWNNIIKNTWAHE